MSFTRSNKVAHLPPVDAELMPYWLQVSRCQEIREQCAMLSAGKEQYCTRLLRTHNAKLQLGTHSWHVMMQMVEAPLKEDREKIMDDFLQQLKDKRDGRRHDANHDADPERILYKCGPVGDLPLHQAFLLGLDDLGKVLIESFYMREDLDGNQFQDEQGRSMFLPKPDAGINTPYVSDLNAWKPLVSNLFDDGGLYSGETVLHIAIVQQKTKLVKWMLERYACITSRAKGAFFKPELSYTEQASISQKSSV
jgi:hypothetical protein